MYLSHIFKADVLHKNSLRLQLENGCQTERVHPLDHALLGLGREVVRPHVLVLGLERELLEDAVVLGDGADLVRGEQDGALDLVLVRAWKRNYII